MKKTRLKLKRNVLITILQMSNIISIITMFVITLLDSIKYRTTIFEFAAFMYVFFVGFILLRLLDDFRQKKTHENLENLESQM